MRVQYHFHIEEEMKIEDGQRKRKVKWVNICVKHAKALPQEYKHNLEPTGRIFLLFWILEPTSSPVFIYTDALFYYMCVYFYTFIPCTTLLVSMDSKFSLYVCSPLLRTLALCRHILVYVFVYHKMLTKH